MEYEEPHLFSLGASPSEWDKRFELVAIREGAEPLTQIRFTRKFRGIDLMERIFMWDLFGTKSQKTIQGLAQDTMDNLVEACGNVAAGRPDGIFTT